MDINKNCFEFLFYGREVRKEWRNVIATCGQFSILTVEFYLISSTIITYISHQCVAIEPLSSVLCPSIFCVITCLATPPLSESTGELRTLVFR